MSFICKNRTVHSHDTVVQAKICWGIMAPPVPVVVRSAPVVRMATPKQIAYVGSLGGSEVDAAAMTVEDCSAYIDLLRKQPKEKPKVETPPDPRLAMIDGLISMIPDGYYAVQADSGETINFLRLNHPKATRSRPNPPDLKIQTQHGPRLDEAAVKWPSGRWSFYKNQGWMLDQLLLLCADHHSSAMRYARELNRCCRCNCELTDARSRHYGIGPECETKNGWGWVIESVNLTHDGRSFETLLALGLIDV